MQGQKNTAISEGYSAKLHTGSVVFLQRNMAGMRRSSRCAEGLGIDMQYRYTHAGVYRQENFGAAAGHPASNTAAAANKVSAPTHHEFVETDG
jgi:Fe-S cluster assembly ATPase SufC